MKVTRVVSFSLNPCFGHLSPWGEGTGVRENYTYC